MYEPGVILDGPDLARQLNDELRRIADSFRSMDLDYFTLVELHAEPSPRIDNMIVLADGTSWDPGSGQGVYCYYNSTWNYLG